MSLAVHSPTNPRKQNVEKAKKEIEKLEQEAATAESSSTPAVRAGRQNHAKKVSSKDTGVNGEVSAEGELAQEKDAVADVTKELKEAKIEDATVAAE